MSYQKDRDEFIGQIVTEVMAQKGTNNDGVDLARLILRNAATIQSIAIRQCNEAFTDQEAALLASRDKACEDRIKEACKPWSIKPHFGGDPRGCCVKLILPSGRYNSWGGAEDGFCVPTR